MVKAVRLERNVAEDGVTALDTMSTHDNPVPEKEIVYEAILLSGFIDSSLHFTGKYSHSAYVDAWPQQNLLQDLHPAPSLWPVIRCETILALLEILHRTPSAAQPLYDSCRYNCWWYVSSILMLFTGTLYQTSIRRDRIGLAGASFLVKEHDYDMGSALAGKVPISTSSESKKCYPTHLVLALRYWQVITFGIHAVDWTRRLLRIGLPILLCQLFPATALHATAVSVFRPTLMALAQDMIWSALENPMSRAALETLYMHDAEMSGRFRRSFNIGHIKGKLPRSFDYYDMGWWRMSDEARSMLEVDLRAFCTDPRDAHSPPQEPTAVELYCYKRAKTHQDWLDRQRRYEAGDEEILKAAQEWQSAALPGFPGSTEEETWLERTRKEFWEFWNVHRTGRVRIHLS